MRKLLSPMRVAIALLAIAAALLTLLSPRSHGVRAEARVVLQEQSSAPLLLPDQFHSSVAQFDALVRAARATTAIYELWPQRDIGQDGAALHREYMAEARQVGALLVPVGPAWASALARHPEVALYQEDQHHAQPAGTFLAACVFFAALTNTSPEGLTGPPGLPPDAALDFERIAWQLHSQR